MHRRSATHSDVVRHSPRCPDPPPPPPAPVPGFDVRGHADAVADLRVDAVAPAAAAAAAAATDNPGNTTATLYCGLMECCGWGHRLSRMLEMFTTAHFGHARKRGVLKLGTCPASTQDFASVLMDSSEDLYVIVTTRARPPLPRGPSPPSATIT